MAAALVVNEIYLSLQGESTFAGLPCVFIRLTACDLRCSYCDTAYAFTEGKKRTLAEILKEVRRRAEPFHGKHLSLTPGFSPVIDAAPPATASAVCPMREAVETAGDRSVRAVTGLKPGVNERCLP